MKIIFTLFVVLILVGCSTDPYKVCYEDRDIASSQKSQNYCIEQVRRQQMAAWGAWSQQQQQNQIQQQQSFPMLKAPVQTNCTTLGNQTNCTTY